MSDTEHINLIAFIILYYQTVNVVHKLGKVKSFAIGSAGFILFQLVFVIFNR